MIRAVGAPRARTFGFALLAALPLLSGCASVIPTTDSGRPATTTPAPSRPAGTPGPTAGPAHIAVNGTQAFLFDKASGVLLPRADLAAKRNGEAA